MSKLREAIAEARHTVNVCRLFWLKYTQWRDANRDSDAVFIHVGSPSIVEDVIKQSPRWQLFEEFEKRHRAELERDALYARQQTDASAQQSAAQRDITAAVHRVAPLLRPAQCDCAACAAARATRETSKVFDA